MTQLPSSSPPSAGDVMFARLSPEEKLNLLSRAVAEALTRIKDLELEIMVLKVLTAKESPNVPPPAA